jgi:sporulation protein YlmC with PRC-barrel domain
MEMRVKVGVVAATAALFLTASGLAQAQQSSSPSGSSGITTQSRPSGSMSSTSSSTRLDRSTLHEVKDDNMTAAGLNVNAKDLQSMAIYGSDGKKIGEVKNVLADSSNQIKAVSADVGGFLGMGAREVVFPIDKLQKGSDKDRLQTAMTKDEIQNLEAWNDNGSSSRSSTSGSSTVPSRSNSGSAPSTGSSSGSSSGSSTGSSVR